MEPITPMTPEEINQFREDVRRLLAAGVPAPRIAGILGVHRNQPRSWILGSGPTPVLGKLFRPKLDEMLAEYLTPQT